MCNAALLPTSSLWRSRSAAMHHPSELTNLEVLKSNRSSRDTAANPYSGQAQGMKRASFRPASGCLESDGRRRREPAGPETLEKCDHPRRYKDNQSTETSGATEGPSPPRNLPLRKR